MPETFDRVERILEHLERRSIPPITLLVVPGKDWQAGQIECLRDWARQGHELAAHGWHHHVPSIHGWRHRLHATLISRNVAEHLALDPAGILRLMCRSHDWFAEHGLPEPTLYVPPAWALGPLSAADLAQLPFRQVETLWHLLSPAAGTSCRLPMVGFEADTPLRALAVGAWNALQVRGARRQPLRIAIHPDDFELRLARPLDRLLDQPFRFLRYGHPKICRSLIDRPAPEPV